MKVDAIVGYTHLENDRGMDIESVWVECTRCGHVEESFGRSEASITRCLALLNENCPNDENNFYEDSGL